MTIFVDALADYPSGKWCHMVTDGELEDLHKMAAAIGMKREWFQDKNCPHYDLRPSKRALAVRKGAVEIDHHSLMMIITLWRYRKAASEI